MKSKIRTDKGAEMSDYTYRRIITDRKGATIVIKEVNVPDEVVKQIRADAIDDFAKWLVEQGILGSRCISDGEITDYGRVYAKKYKEQLKERKE